MTKSSAVDIKPAYINQNDLVLDPKLLNKSLLERMPKPTGWRLLVLPYKGKGCLLYTSELPTSYAV